MCYDFDSVVSLKTSRQRNLTMRSDPLLVSYDVLKRTMAGFSFIVWRVGRVSGLLTCSTARWDPCSLSFVFVSCSAAGVSRSVSIFFMYMMAYHHIKLSSLWYHLYSIR